MDIKEIEALLALVEKAEIAEFDYTSENGERVYVNKCAPQQVTAPAQITTPMPAVQVAPNPAQEATQATAESTPATDNAITAPLVGTFYSANSPEANPFVSVGQTVAEGDVVCIIEAMKIMNQVRADKDGTVTEVLVSNGQPVEYGQALFRLQ